VLLPGSGSELYRGVGAVVLGGLALATFLTLFVVPALFTVVWRVSGRA
jgi:HAE1 family hydrophobic/amphiphilic exporter-1